MEFDLNKIKDEAYAVLKDKVLSEQELQDKYVYLYSSSKTLFKMIIRDKKSGEFKKRDFDKHLENTLNLISNMRLKNISKEDGTKSILEKMNTAYIPSKFLKK